MNLLSGSLSGPSTANLRPGVPGVITNGWPESGFDQTGLGTEELREDGREVRSGTDIRKAQGGGKNKALEGLCAFRSSTSFLCVWDKVTRSTMDLAQRKQLFGGSVEFISDHVRFPFTNVHCFTLPPPCLSLWLSPHQAVLQGCFRLSLRLYFCLSSVP